MFSKVHWHASNQAIKAFTRLMLKRIFNVHSRLWTLMYKEYSKENIILDVTITARHCCFTIRTWLHQMEVLQIILSETKGTFWWSECSAQHMFYEQYSRWKIKSKIIKEILSHSIRVRHVWGLVLHMDHTIPQSMGMKMQNPLSSLLHAFQGKSRKTLSNNILMYLVQMTLLMDNTQKFIRHAYDEPINSSTFMQDEPRWRSWLTQTKIIENATTF